MNWLYIALLSPALWAVGNHIDKFLLEKRLREGGVGSLILFSSLIGLVPVPVILYIHPAVLDISLRNAGIVVLNGALYVVSLLPYLHALHRDEASIVVPLFQTTAVFSYAFGWLVLGETLTPLQGFAAALIILGSVALSVELKPRGYRLKTDVLLLMLAASLLNALNWLLFKFVAVQEDFWVSSFWEYIGFISFGLLAFLWVKPWRDEFVAVLKANRASVLALVALNEGVSLAAKVSTNVASLTAPLALISTVHGLQPAFVLLYGVLLTLFVPSYGRENLAKRVIVQKIAAIALTITGTYMLGTSG
jgi:uncharacterized membrane protein